MPLGYYTIAGDEEKSEDCTQCGGLGDELMCGVCEGTRRNTQGIKSIYSLLSCDLPGLTNAYPLWRGVRITLRGLIPSAPWEGVRGFEFSKSQWFKVWIHSFEMED